MGETTVADQLVEFFSGAHLVWVIVIAMSALGSLIGVFTFCVRRKRADYTVSRRKKTDEPSPDDNAVDERYISTTDESRTHDVAVETIGRSRVPVISTENEVVKDTREVGEGSHPIIKKVEPLINGVEDEEEVKEEMGGGSEQEMNEIGPEDVPRLPAVSEEREAERQTERETEEVEVEVVEVEIEREPEREAEEEPEREAERETERETELQPTEQTNAAVEDTHMRSIPNGISDDHTHHNEVDSNKNVAMVNGGISEGEKVNGEGGVVTAAPVVNGDTREDKRRWSFPPKLEDFDLMETDIDPVDLEAIFADYRLVEIYLDLDPDSPGLGISIVGGTGSPTGGDLPIIIKRVLPNSLAERDGRLQPGDELIAVNDALLVGVAKDAAIETLSNLSGNVRLLVIQDD